MTKLKVRRVGSSLGVILPKHVVENLRVDIGDTLYVTETRDGIQISPYNPEFDAAMKSFDRTRNKFRNAFRELSKR